MKIKIPIFLIFALAFLCGIRATHAQELTQTFTTPEGFSIKLPADWKRIDKQILEDSTKELAKDMPNAKFQIPSDGFHPNTIEQGIGYPNIIIVPNNLGKMSEEDFKQLAMTMKEKLQQKINSNFENNTLNATANAPDVSYDEHGHFIRVVMTGSVPDLGMIHSVDIHFRTDSGMLSFKFVSTEKEYGQYTDLFSKIIGSIETPKAILSTTAPAMESVPVATDGSTESKSADSDKIESIAYNIGRWIPLVLIGVYWAHKARKKQDPKNTTQTDADNNPKKP